MVSLEMVEYLRSVENNTKLKLFHDVINGNDIHYDDIVNPSEVQYINLIKAVLNNNKEEFLHAYSVFSERKLANESPWIYDNYLIFIILIGVFKYKLERQWILQVLEFRKETQIESQNISKTIKNIVQDNFASKENLFEIVFVFQDLLNIELSPIEELDLLYSKLASDKNSLLVRDDFIKLIRIRVVDIIVLYKDLIDGSEFNKLKLFKIIFNKRIKVASNAIFVLFIAAIILVIFYFQINHLNDPNYKEPTWINIITIILSVLGVGLVAIFKWISKKIAHFFKWIFGYSKYFNEKE